MMAKKREKKNRCECECHIPGGKIHVKPNCEPCCRCWRREVEAAFAVLDCWLAMKRKLIEPGLKKVEKDLNVWHAQERELKRVGRLIEKNFRPKL